MSCPVCSGPKTKRAQLCSSCRPKAIAAGVTLLLAAANTPSLGEIATWASTPSNTASAELKLTDGQRRAFYAKANRLDALMCQTIGTTKREVLTAIRVEHTNDLTQEQASSVLDEIEARVAHAQGDEPGSTTP